MVDRTMRAEVRRPGDRMVREPRRRGPHGATRPVRLAAIAALLLVAVGCGSTSAGPGDASVVSTTATSTPATSPTSATEPGEASAAAALDQGATVIDVRTPDEYAGGHIEGSELVDIQGSDFDARIEALDDSVTYVVYCRTGVRSAVATQRMRDAGLTVLDGGGLDDMVAAGWPTTG